MAPLWPGSLDSDLRRYAKEAKPDENGNGLNNSLLIGSWVALLCDSPIDFKPEKVARKFFKNLVSDLSGVKKEFSLLCDKLVSSIVVDDFGDYTVSLHDEFRRTPVFREYNHWFETGNLACFSYLLTFLWFGKKAETVDPTLEPLAFRQWQEIESDLGNLTPPEHVLEDLRYILTHLPNPDIEQLSFRFGHKRVSERSVRKYSDKLKLRYSEGLAECFDNIQSDIPGLSIVIPDEEVWELGKSDVRKASIDFSTLRFVPKDYKSVRSICMEPNTYMFHQQGILAMLMHAIDHSAFSQVIDIRDQSKNAAQALLSSEDGLYDTIDLSAASDRISNAVVNSVFSYHWLYHFQASRTSSVRTPDGSIVRVNKFAPMGSALCFPVQSLIFAAVTCLARSLTLSGRRVSEYLSSGSSVVAELNMDIGTRVYGDDIICPSCDTEAVISLLEILGFRVNLSKSFYGSRKFRESCGTFAIHGRNVTPIIFKVKGLIDRSLNRVPGLIDLHNRLWEREYHACASFIKGFIPRKFYVEVNPRHTPYVHGSFVHSYAPQNKLKRVYNSQACRWEYEVKVLGARVRPVNTESSDRYQYSRSLQSSNHHVRHITSDGQEDEPPYGDVDEPTVHVTRVYV